MSHSYLQNVLHIVFSTKERRKTIPKEFQPRLWSYVAGICQHSKIFVHAIGGMEDHIHCLVQVPATLAVAEALRTLKSNSSRWAGQEGCEMEWQQGYGGFSVSASIVPTVVRYIQNQEKHHKKMTFEEEFLALLKKHGVKYDPKYVFG